MHKEKTLSVKTLRPRACIFSSQTVVRLCNSFSVILVVEPYIRIAILLNWLDTFRLELVSVV